MPHSTLTGLGVLVIEGRYAAAKADRAHLRSLGADVTGAATREARGGSWPNSSSTSRCSTCICPMGAGRICSRKAFSPNTGVIVMTATAG